MYIYIYMYTYICIYIYIHISADHRIRRVKERMIATSVASRAGGIFRQTPPKIVPDLPRPCQAVPDLPRPCQAVLGIFLGARSPNPLLKMIAGGPKVRTLCSKWKLTCTKCEPFAQNGSWSVQSTNPLLEMTTGAPKIRTLCSSAEGLCPDGPGTESLLFRASFSIPSICLAARVRRAA